MLFPGLPAYSTTQRQAKSRSLIVLQSAKRHTIVYHHRNVKKYLAKKQYICNISAMKHYQYLRTQMKRLSSFFLKLEDDSLSNKLPSRYEVHSAFSCWHRDILEICRCRKW